MPPGAVAGAGPADRAAADSADAVPTRRDRVSGVLRYSRPPGFPGGAIRRLHRELVWKRLSRRNLDPDADSHPNPICHRDQLTEHDADQKPERHPVDDANAHADPDAFTDGNAQHHAFENPDAHADTNAEFHADPYPDAHPDAHADGAAGA